MDVKPDTADRKNPDRAVATILVVDDEPANLAVLNPVLQPHFRVRVARSGAEALRAVGTAQRPDLVLLDVMMPVMDGDAVLARLREDPVTRDLHAECEQRLRIGEIIERIGVSLGPSCPLRRAPG